MECDVCNQETATIFLTQLVEGKVQKVKLCDTCAKTKGVTDPTGYNLAELLKGKGENSVQAKSSRGLICSNCGFSQSDFKKSGRMGCSECYSVFVENLEGLLKAMHKDTAHTGKVPENFQAEKAYGDQIDRLQRQLAHSIEHENYEEAARIRDELRQLESRVIEQETEV